MLPPGVTKFNIQLFSPIFRKRKLLIFLKAKFFFSLSIIGNLFLIKCQLFIISNVLVFNRCVTFLNRKNIHGPTIIQTVFDV